MNRKSLRLVLAAALGATVGMAANAASLPNIDFNRAFGVAKDVGTALTPLEEKDEIAIGRELAGRTMDVAPLVNAPALQAYVNRVGRSIAAQSERRDLPWRFGVLDSPSVNAFASPGGIVLITRGLYEILDNEAQLAGAIGHEIAHVEKSHHANVMRKQAFVSAGRGAAEIYAANRAKGLASVAADTFIGPGALFLTTKLDRSAELEADQLGALLAAKAGYNPAGLVDVLHKLNARAGDSTTNLLTATHPHPSERLTALGEALAPRMASLPEGKEPPLQVAGSSLPAPTVTAGQPRSAGRALSAEQQPQQKPPASSDAAGGQGSGSGIDPTQLFRGLIRR